MRFKSDAQRRACFANLSATNGSRGCHRQMTSFSRDSEFSLKYDSYTGRVTSTEYPNVDFILFVDYPKEALKALKNIPEQHLSGLGAIVADEYVGGGRSLKPHQLAMHTAGVPVYDRGKGEEVSVIRIRSPKDIAMYYEEHPELGDYEFEDVLAHEIGHDVIANVLGRRKMVRDKGASEIVADKFMLEHTGAEPKHTAEKEEDLERAHAYIETLQELKTPSMKELSGYASKFSIDHIGYRKAIESLENDLWENKVTKGEYDTKLAEINKQFLGLSGDGKFSFDDRVRKGWYPRDSNLPDDFDNVVLNTTFKVLRDRYGHFDPDDENGKSVITGMVCQELDKNWRSEWGKRPDGRYIKADVEDALEVLE